MNKNLDGLRKAYEADTQTVEELCQQFQISSAALYQMAKVENWTMRRQKKEAKEGHVSLAETATETPLKTLVRLRKIARQYVRDLSNELNSTNGVDADEGAAIQPSMSASERERGVRSLRLLLKIIEEIAELEVRFKSSGRNKSRKEIDSKQRLDLARRIKAIRDKN